MTRLSHNYPISQRTRQAVASIDRPANEVPAEIEQKGLWMSETARPSSTMCAVPCILFASMLLITPLAIGCGPTADTVAPVSGRVTVDGKPVKNASIQFTPVGKRAAGAITDDNGNYKLSTYGQFDGAVLGEHKVAISLRKPIYMGPPKKNPDPEPVSDDPNVLTVRPAEGGVPKQAQQWKSPVPEKYWDDSTSGLTRVVEGKGENNFDFELKSQP